MQALLPTKAAYEPGSHGEQSARAAPPGCARKEPAGQKESQIVEPLAGASDPGAQRRQAAREATGEKEPAGQGSARDAPGQ